MQLHAVELLESASPEWEVTGVTHGVQERVVAASQDGVLVM